MVRKRYYAHDRFTKTGSGQNIGKTEQMTVFCDLPQGMVAVRRAGVAAKIEQIVVYAPASFGKDESSEALQAIMDSTFAHNAWVVPKQLLTASSRVLPDPASGVQKVFRQKIEVRQWSFLHFYIQMIILPRQAWDKHRENPQKRDGFLAGRRGARRTHLPYQCAGRTGLRIYSRSNASGRSEIDPDSN